MKKIALTFLMFIVVLPTVFATDSPPFRFGLKASPNISWMRPETRDYESEGLRLGFSYGAIADFHLGGNYSLSTGLNITYTGGKLSYPVEEGRKERTYRLQYVELPLAVKMRTQEIGYITYYGKFGFGAGANLRATADDRLANVTEEDVDIKGDTPLMRASLIIGAGIEYSLGGNTALLAGLTFNNGFTNVLQGRNEVSDRKKSAVANYLQVTLGVMF